MKLGRWLTISGGVLLLLTGLMHGYGHHFAEPQILAALKSDPQLLSVVQSMWWAFSLEFVMLGLIVLWAVRFVPGRGLILLCGLIPALTTLVILRYVGVFIGDIMLGCATVLLLVGGFMLPRSRESHPASRMW
jgi:hypothetical protein